MKKKIMILSLIMIYIISMLSITVNAADTNDYSFTVSMTANNSKVEAGSEVLITVKISNLNVGENGINSFSAYLSYDTEVFETLTDSSVDGINGWIPSYSTGSGKVSLLRQTFLKTDEEIMQISLKTKKDLSVGKTGDVKLSTIFVSNSSEEIMAKPVSTTITIGSGSSGNVISPIVITDTNTTVDSTVVLNNIENTNTTNQNIINTNISNTNSLQNMSINSVKDNKKIVNESKNDIPYTGTENDAIARIIIGLIVICLVIYIKIEQINKDIK